MHAECLTNPLEPISEFSAVFVPLICDKVRMYQGRPTGSGTVIVFIVLNLFCKKGKAVPLQARGGPQGSRKLRFQDFVTKAQIGGRLSALRTGRLYPQEMLLVFISVRS